MLDAALDLGGTVNVRATADRVALSTQYSGAAHRAVAREAEPALLAGAPLSDDLHHLGDDIAGALNDDHVTDADVFAVNLILIVQASAPDNHPT